MALKDRPAGKDTPQRVEEAPPAGVCGLRLPVVYLGRQEAG